MKKCICITSAVCVCVCVSYLPQRKTHYHAHTHSISIQTTKLHMEKPTVKHSEECVELSVGPLSCGRHKWCFVWVEDAGTQPLSLFHVLEAFNLPPWSSPPPPPSFHTSSVGKASFTLNNVVHSPFLFLNRLLLIWLTMARQYTSLVSITTCLLGSSETSRPTRSPSVCELLFVASGCFQLERGHRHCLKVVISQHWFEATVEIGNNVGYYNPQLQ